MTEFIEFNLEPADNERLANLCGPFNEHLRQIESHLGVEINNHSNYFKIIGEPAATGLAGKLIKDLYTTTDADVLTKASVHLFLQESGMDKADDLPPSDTKRWSLKLNKGTLTARGAHQVHYLENIHQYDLTFGVGPAGTGKTYLAVACAVEALEKEQVQRLVLVRPAVEAGERLGFLPGDLAQKIDPYLRPMYDALYEMLGFQRVDKLIERNIIEIAPLAYMRGRTLNDAFIIMDEAQNTTIDQMKMFLTRIGFGSTAVVTGDITQVDLPRDKASGLRHAVEVLKGTNGVGFTFFNSKDVVRHPLVQKIIDAYEQSGG